MAKTKPQKARPRELVLKQLESTKNALDKLDKRIARLSSIRDRLAYATNMSERNRAILQESINEWIADYRETNFSDGIEFESLHVDFLLLDEAQNMKNLWPVGRREGGVPKYLGAISEGSDRALAFALRAFLTQRETGGSGVALLSATPAKNSPLEFFTLLGFVDHYGWTRRNILDPEYFIDRYLRLEQKTILKPDGTVESRSAVVGFKSLHELRDIVFRYGDFKDAKDVGLKLPESRQDRAFIPMNEAQRTKYADYRAEYESIVTSRDVILERHRALGILQKMALVALHPELDEPPLLPTMPGKKPRRQWTWANAVRVGNPSSPKLAHCVRLIMQRPECGHIVFCDNIAVHRWLKGLLIAEGIDPSRIAVLNADQAKTPLIRQEIAEGFNGVPAVMNPETGQIEQEATLPKFDIVIANAVAYEGIDLQVRTCRVVHLDLPFEPATLQQRNGRAVRQGNLQAVIEIVYLLSEKSYDAVKLGMITGKLRWMSDILKGADRETNNPAAGMDLSTEDLLLMLADDPEAAKAAMEQVKQRNELERQRQVESRAWQRLGDLLSYVWIAQRRDEELEREQARKQVEGAVAYLRAVPADIWPWHFVIEKALAGVPTSILTVFVSGEVEAHPSSMVTRPLWEGLYLPISQGRGIYFARVGGSLVSLREQGDHRWQRPQSLPKSIGNAIGMTRPESYQVPPPDDTPEWSASLKQAIGELRWRGLEVLGLVHAPEFWRDLVWSEFGAEIVERIAAWNYETPVRAGETLVFRAKASWQDVIPPTDLGFAEFLQRVKEGRFTYADMTERAKGWWGREFPRGGADDRPIAKLISPETDQAVTARLESTPQEGFAVAEVEQRKWQVAHLPTSALLSTAFTDLDGAKLAVRWLASIASDGQALSLDARRISLLRWISEQSDLPTLAGVVAKFRATETQS